MDRSSHVYRPPDPGDPAEGEPTAGGEPPAEAEPPGEQQPSADEEAGGGQRGLSRRALLKGLGVVGVLTAGGVVVARTFDGEPAPTVEPPAGDAHDLDAFADNVQRGGPPPDGIPSIDDPVYVAADDAGFLEPDDVVFGLVVDGEPRAYPQLVLVWHEIVNEVDAEGPLSTTYCPLTGSVVGYRPHAQIEEFGTSGNLVNSNLLTYDRAHESHWPQILGKAIDGPRRGDRLHEFPLEWTTWQRWRDVHPDTAVLCTDTGYVRRYGEDPYGSYNPLGGYYEPESGTMFPVMHDDDRFPPKEVFFGTKVGDARLAVHKALVADRLVVATEADGEPTVFLHDPALDTARAFRAVAGGEPLAFSVDEPGTYVDDETGSTWDAEGRAVDGPHAGEELERVLAYDVMWFAWAAFYPQTEVIA